MSLRERLGAVLPVSGTAFGPLTDASDVPAASARSYQSIKAQVHQNVLTRLDLQALGAMPPAQVRDELRTVIERLLVEQNLVLNAVERRNLVLDVQHELLGLGPLEPLLDDPTISDILVNTSRQVYVERKGRLELTEVTFVDDAHLMNIIDKIVSRVGRRVDESSPMVDARLPDGSRVNAIIPPLAIDGPILSIRRFPAKTLKVDDLIALKSMSPEMANTITALAQAKLNVIVSGGTGSGKTTLLNLLSGFISAAERIVTIEDAAELQLQQPHVVRLETRPANLEGHGEVAQRALVRNALRMRPDRIILGETRGSEAMDMLQAMNTGHEGSMTTIHANTSRDALARLESMIAMAGVDLPPRAARAQIASAVSIVIQVNRLSDGSRKITGIHEITGMEGDIITSQEIFGFKQTGVSPEGAVLGHFVASGVRPRFWERLLALGIRLPENTFHPVRRTV
jgi:pilus assembly protein CpaF